MENPAQMCARLVAALEDLTAQEAASLEARDFEATIVLQDRAAPLIEHLVTHWPAVADSSLKTRILAVISRRNKTGEWLAEQIAETRRQLQETQVAERRVARIAPAYGLAAAGARRQLHEVG
jgi:hypothetical protein